ncbi:MAG: PocR ligand-binding domain-containing protein [Anaerolineae bacterium]|nr:PocR ligand-binding domain-containing protein [Anaerolineae bacterium]
MIQQLAESPAKGLSVEDVVDISVLQRIQDRFAKAMGVAAVTVDRNGKPVTEASNFQSICLTIRSTEKGLARCMKCDATGALKSYRAGEPQTYLCSGGMIDVAAPIIIDGEYMGGILCGQVVLTEKREAFIEKIIERNVPLGFSEDYLRSMAKQVPAIPRERLDAAVEMMFVMANHIAEMGVAHVTKNKLLKEAEEKAKLQEALQHAQLRALEAQVNPHFLFNALTLVGYTAIAEKAHQTEEITFNLSDLLRYSLRNVAKQVLVTEEFEMVERYLAIQKLRFGSRLQFKVKMDPAIEQLYIPCMILQPLVENAVLHGVEPMTNPVSVEINATRTDDYLHLTVADDGAGIDPAVIKLIEAGDSPSRNGRARIGLQGVIRRLKGEYGHQFSFTIKRKSEHGTLISLQIPVNGRV